MISAGIVVYRMTSESSREYLLLQYAAGHWDFAKGKVEKDETLETAALRELKEEAAIEVQIAPGFSDEISYFFIDCDGRKAFKRVHFFIGFALINQDIGLSREHVDYVWLPFEAAREKLTYDTAKKVLENVECFLRTKRDQ